MANVADTLDRLFDEELVYEELSSKNDIAKRAVEHVMEIFEKYRDDRRYRRGGIYVDETREWDKLYRNYRCIYVKYDHNYDGEAEIFTPELRKAVNVIESEAGNALFGRDDYFSVEPMASDDETIEMSREAYGTLKYYSDMEDFVYNFELAKKQCLIYGHTWVETVYDKSKVTGPYRMKIEEPQLDPQTGEPYLDPQTGEPIINTRYEIVQIDEDKPTIRIEVRDVYRMYINHLANDPEKDDIIYRDAMSSQKLLELAEREVYNKEAVMKMIKGQPVYGGVATQDIDGSGEGKTFIEELRTNQKGQASSTDTYEVLRFQGLFTTLDETSGKKIKKQFWIDIGERTHCLRCTESPVIGNYKTFSGTNYDSMNEEFYSDGPMRPYLKTQSQMNDKENQSVDGLTFNLNAPVLVPTGSRLKASDFIQARKQPNKVLFTQSPDKVVKMLMDIPLQHLNAEQIRLTNMIQSGTGATSLASGSPTGTQVDRSGKAVGTLLQQSRSQFSKFLRKFEKRLIQRSLQKGWDIIIQFFDDEIVIPVQGDDGKFSSKMQRPSEIIGRFRIRVSSGSQHIKEKEHRDSILELLSVAGMSDQFMQSLDTVPMLQDIAMSLSPRLAKYINPDNIINQQQQQIQQLQQQLQDMGVQSQKMFNEAKRLEGELKQTDRSQRISPSEVEKAEGATDV